MQRSAHAEWSGDFKTGRGRVSTESGDLSNAGFSYNDRFGNGRGTNPEQLLAAAHGACFSMALTIELGDVGIAPEKISTNANVSLEHKNGQPTITGIHLTVHAKVAAGEEDALRAAAMLAKDNCPISRLLKADVTMDFTLER